MSKTKKKRSRKLREKTSRDLVLLLKRMNKREDSFIQHIKDLEFYIVTLEEEYFDEDNEDDDEGEIKLKTPETDEVAPEDVQVYTIDQILAELETPKKKKKKKGKKKWIPYKGHHITTIVILLNS